MPTWPRQVVSHVPTVISLYLLCLQCSGTQGRQTHRAAWLHVLCVITERGCYFKSVGPVCFLFRGQWKRRIGCESSGALVQTLHLMLSRARERRKTNTQMPEHTHTQMHVWPYTQLILIIQRCDPDTKTSKSLCEFYGKEFNLCIQKQKGKNSWIMVLLILL